MRMHKATEYQEYHFTLVCWELWRSIFILLDPQVGGLTVEKAPVLCCQKTWHGSLKSFQICWKMEELLKVVCRNLMTGALIQDGGHASLTTFQAYSHRRFWEDSKHGLNVLNCQEVKDCMDLCSCKSMCCATLTSFVWELFWLQPCKVLSASENWLVVLFTELWVSEFCSYSGPSYPKSTSLQTSCFCICSVHCCPRFQPACANHGHVPCIS